MPNFISRKDILATFDISVWTLRRWQKHRGFPEPISVSGIKKMYIKSEVDAWVLNNATNEAAN
jgi:predicted DNA-binding transcriptional regulator AlpA